MRNLDEESQKNILKNNYCFIGNNNTCKTYILNQISELNKKEKRIVSLYMDSEYFITNDVRPSNDVNDKVRLNMVTVTINDNNRIKEIFQIIIGSYFEKYYELLSLFKESENNLLNKYFERDPITFKFSKKVHCSSGINSLLAIIACCLYCQIHDINAILIDELDKHLDSINSYRITTFLQEQFSNLKIIMSTHSEDVIAALKNYKIYDVERGVQYNSNNYNDILTIKNKFFYVKDNVDDQKKVNFLKEEINEYLYKIEFENGLTLSDKKRINDLNTLEILEKLDDYDLENLKLLLQEVAL